MEKDQRIRVSLLTLRTGVFIVMFMWTIDKFARPEHAAAVFRHFYFIEGLSHAMSYMVGALEMLIILLLIPISYFSRHGQCWPHASLSICYETRIRC